MLKAEVTFKDLNTGFDTQLADVIRAVDENLLETADYVRDEAKRSSVFADKTGKLRRSIRRRKSKFENGGYIVYSRAPHAHLVEFGHVMIAWGKITGRRVKPHPYMRPALEKGIRRAISLMKSSR